MRSRSTAAHFGRELIRTTLEHIYRDGMKRTYSGASTADLERLFSEALPEKGRAPLAVLEECRRKILKHSMQVTHPRVFGLFNPSPLPIAAFAELPAALLNQSLDLWKSAPAATHVEMRLIRWMNDLIGFGRKAFGVFTSGGGVANTIALKIARDRATGLTARRRGLGRSIAGRLRVYASDQAHFSILRSLDILGIGENGLVKIPTDGGLKMRPEALAAAIRRDRRRGLHPVAVVATAGTTNTGTIDPLPPITRIARRERIHCHVDAAYGGALVFSRRFRSRLDGLERSDSVTIDPHKWLFQPFSLGGLFVRDKALLEDSFRIEPDYLRKDLESEPGRVDFYHYSLEGSRSFRGLKLWFTLKTLGRRGLGELVDRTMDIALDLDAKVRRMDEFELYPISVELASVCFRYLPPWARRMSGTSRLRGTARARLDRLQTAIQQRIERTGEAWFPVIALREGIFFRFGIFNYRTTPRDVDATLRLIRRTAHSLHGGA
jgi:aromatic-L-amino-acid decarboxylase